MRKNVLLAGMVTSLTFAFLASPLDAAATESASAPTPISSSSTCRWTYPFGTSHAILSDPRVDSARIGTAYPNTSASGDCAYTSGGSYSSSYGCGQSGTAWVALYNISGHSRGYIEATCMILG